MKNLAKFALSLVMVLGVLFLLPTTSVKAVNPYLPLWEHLPDGEPRVFEDPDNPGKYRAYIFGSHDLRYSEYCGADIRAWSAPIEDLTKWRDEGSIFTYQASNGNWDLFYAPDIVEIVKKDGKKEYYLYPQSMSRSAMVCKGDSPVGPFTPLNLNSTGGTLSGSIMGFDPSVYVEQITDPSDPDYDIGFRAYGYWGATFQETRSRAAELDQNTMYSVRPGKSIINNFMPCSSAYGILQTGEPSTYPYIFPGESYTNFNFFEASSIRKVKNKYIMIFSGYSGPDYGLGSTNSAMRWCYGDTPLGPWKYGGVLVDSRAPIPNETGTALTTSNGGHNTHGSIEEINGQWYAFYHRPPRNFGYARQSMVAPIKIECDSASVADGGKVKIRAYDPYSNDNTWTAKAGGNEYTGAEVTSEGFEIFGLDPYKYYSAGIACTFLNGAGDTIQDAFDIWDDHMPMTKVANKHIIGFKYFGFGGLASDQKGLKAFEGTKPGNNTKLNLFLKPNTTNAFKINIWMDGPYSNSAWNGTKIGEINVPANSAQITTKFTSNVLSAVDNADKKHAIYLVVEGSNANFDFIGLGFSSDTKEIVRPAVPQTSILVDGTPITMPATPVRSTAQNGLTGYNLYKSTYVIAGATKTPVITATSTNKDVKISIKQASSPNGMAEVAFDYNGVVKTYQVVLTTVAPPVQDLIIDMSKQSAVITQSNRTINFSAQTEDWFNLKNYQKMVVTYTTQWTAGADRAAMTMGKLALAGSLDQLTGFDDGVTFNYNINASGGTNTLTIPEMDSTAVGINIQPMTSSYNWPDGLTSITITGIKFVLRDDIVQPPGTPAPTPSPAVTTEPPKETTAPTTPPKETIAPTVPPAVTSVVLNKSNVKLGVKETFQLRTAITPINATNKDITYSSKGSAAKVNKTGKITAVKVGTATITASASNGVKASIQVSVLKAPSNIKIINGKSKTLKKGKSLKIKVKFPSKAWSNKVTYKSNKKSIASVTASGKVTAHKKGTAIITVNTFNKKKAKLIIRVK